LIILLVFFPPPTFGHNRRLVYFQLKSPKHSPVVHQYASLRIKKFYIMFAPKIHTFTSHGLRRNSD